MYRTLIRQLKLMAMDGLYTTIENPDFISYFINCLHLQVEEHKDACSFIECKHRTTKGYAIYEIVNPSLYH